jgi:exopolysaccharide production protein ExoY
MSDLQLSNRKSNQKFNLATVAGSSGDVLRTPPLRQSFVAYGLKRSIDVIVAATALFLLLPLFFFVALLVSVDGGPVFYRHRRVGRGGTFFGCWKFRTMTVDAEQALEEYLSYHPTAAFEWSTERKLSFDPRITPIGSFLRKSSLDELPQLLNVLQGDMSLVGPRPVTVQEMSHYGSSARFYRSVLPGITGLWQVSGRNDVGYAQRVAMDEHYVSNWSIGLDIAILLRTPAAVFSRRGAR